MEVAPSPLKPLAAEQARHRRLKTRKSLRPGELERMRRASLANVVLYPMHVMRVSDFRKLRRGDHLPHQQLKAMGLLTEWHHGMGSVAFISHQWLAWQHADPDFEQLAVLQRIVERIAVGELRRIGYSFEHEFIDWKMDEMKPIEQPDLIDWVENGYIWFDYFCVPQILTTAASTHTRASLPTPSHRAQPAAPAAAAAAAGKEKVPGSIPAYYDASQAANDLKSAVDSIPAYVEQSRFVLCPIISWEGNPNPHSTASPQGSSLSFAHL